MNKTELIDRIATENDISKTKAAQVIDSLIFAITETLHADDKLTLVGFGTFSLGKRAARTGRNPRTGETIKIKAAKVPKFSAGAVLKASVNEKKKPSRK